MEAESNQLVGHLLQGVLLCGGLIAAALVYLRERKRPPNRAALTAVIVERSWSTRSVLILLGTLFLLYFAAAFAGQFFYEERIPAVRLAVTYVIYALLVIMVALFNRARGADWAGAMGMGRGDLKKLLFSPVIYLAVIPFIMLLSKGWHELLSRFAGGEVAPQDVAEMVANGPRSWLEICYMLTAIFIAPIYEELIFRSVAFPYFVKRGGLAAGVVIVSVLFALMHFHAPSLAALALLSATLCLAYWRTSSLWTSVGIHMIFNAVSILSLNVAN